MYAICMRYAGIDTGGKLFRSSPSRPCKIPFGENTKFGLDAIALFTCCKNRSETRMSREHGQVEQPTYCAPN